ncbi:hypothetical protein QUF76_08395 [Desulfobacterales bacterium HSG16]|nr:hypothetical protein [Desulfobacterales bacterium HSG16]
MSMDERKLAKMMMDCRTMQNRQSRDAVVDQLPPEIKNTVNRLDMAFADTLNIVGRCKDFNDGLKALVCVLKDFEGDSNAMRNVEKIMSDHEKEPGQSNGEINIFYNPEKEKGQKQMENPRFGIITALPKELAAMYSMLDDPEETPGKDQDTNIYYAGNIPSGANSGYHKVVLTSLAKMGTNMASMAAAHMLRSFPSVQDVLMVGIAGGVPAPDEANDHVRLGDIVVCNEYGVIQYGNLKISEKKVKVRSTATSPSALLLRYSKQLEAKRLMGKYPWEEHFKRAAGIENTERPKDSEDRLFATGEPAKRLRHPKDPIRLNRPGQPRLHYGAIGSADILLKNAELRDKIAKLGIRAIEMEGSGIADASWDLKQGYMIIRGICDYCDDNKNDVWQGYAAVVAAGYARALLESVPAENNSSRKAGSNHENRVVISGNNGISIGGDLHGGIHR